MMAIIDDKMESWNLLESAFSKKNNFSQKEKIVVVWSSIHLFWVEIKFLDMDLVNRDVELAEK
jgi:hypothetical protein